jgi:hypothetical protein
VIVASDFPDAELEWIKMLIPRGFARGTTTVRDLPYS